MEDSIRIDGYYFENITDNEMYECRGEVHYDDEHDETPEPGLWSAANELAERLRKEGFKDTYPTYSEKGWVEVIY